jgi:ATP-dependent Clp protease ATP-binding subunit ClpA
MFERYTERARRVIFFARYEAAQFGSTTIESEHFLLGLIREDKNITSRYLRTMSDIDYIRSEIAGRSAIREKVSTATDLPLSTECKRILAYAAEEAERLNHRHIGTEHLLLGILREEKSLAAEILQERGLRLNTIREELSRAVVDRQGAADPKPYSVQLKDPMVPDGETAKLIATAIWLPAYGGKTTGGDLVAEVIQSSVWRVTAGPLFAFINVSDGKILAMGMNQVGKAGV